MFDNQIIIIGAGPAGLMAAQHLAMQGLKVHVYEQNKAAARKFLVAGNGGFNLTHSENIDVFLEKYEAEEIRQIVGDFDNNMVVAWLADLGISTYAGSSGKIFPTKNFKPIHVLKAWLDRLNELGVEIHYEHTFLNFDESHVFIKHQDVEKTIKYSRLILSMGGGSWKKTGSDAKWIPLLKQKKVRIKPLEPANSGYNTAETFHHLQGQYLKNISVAFENEKKSGEIVFTKYGIEGSPIYYLNRFTRKYNFPLTINLDLKPILSEGEISEALSGNEKFSKVLKKKLKLSTTAINLLKTLDKENYTQANRLATLIKNFPVEVLSFRPLDEVISTAGGVSFSDLNKNLEMKNFPRVYCIGEMLDWEAPTGGYLLQACFSTGVWVARAIAESEDLKPA